MGSSLNSKRIKMAKGKGKKKAKNISNVYSCFEQSQIQEFKEAFEMIDANRDGFIDKDDLKSTYASLGCMTVENEKLTNMMSEASGAINFTVPIQKIPSSMPSKCSTQTMLARSQRTTLVISSPAKPTDSPRMSLTV